jgi:hypothetical protein
VTFPVYFVVIPTGLKTFQSLSAVGVIYPLLTALKMPPLCRGPENAPVFPFDLYYPTISVWIIIAADGSQNSL